MKKSKIQIFEEKLVKEKITDKKLQEYEALLKRVGDDWNRIQHCFITAYNFSIKRVNEAVKLIEFGNEKYGSDKSNLIRSYEMLGTIYERAGMYQEAYDIYVDIYPNIKGFQGNFPWCLLDTKMQVDNFMYSPELEKYIVLCEQMDEFNKSFVNHQFILELAKYIVADYYNDSNNKEKTLINIKTISKPEYKGPLYELLKRKRYNEQLNITDRCRSFLKKINK